MTPGPNRNAEDAIPVHIDQDLEGIVPGFLENRRRDVQTLETALRLPPRHRSGLPRMVRE